MGHERASTTLDLYTRRTDNADRILEALNDPDDDPSEPAEDDDQNGDEGAPSDERCRITAAWIMVWNDETPGRWPL